MSHRAGGRGLQQTGRRTSSEAPLGACWSQTAPLPNSVLSDTMSAGENQPRWEHFHHGNHRSPPPSPPCVAASLAGGECAMGREQKTKSAR